MHRRKQESLRHRRRVEVRYGEPGGQLLIGYSGNISMSGMMLRTPRVFPPGMLLVIELKAPTASMTLRGRVVWAREGPIAWLATGRVGMGIKFLEAPPPGLADFLKKAASA